MESLDSWRHLKRSMKIKLHTLHGDRTSLETWQNLNASSLIGWIGFDDDDSYPSISSKPLIEDQQPNPNIHAKILSIYSLSLTKNVFSDISSNRTI